jgi:protease PrsW
MAAVAAESSVANLLRQSALFRRLSDSVLQGLAARLLPTSFPAGATVLHEGESGGGAFLIVRGKAAIGSSNLIGQQVMLGVLGPGDTFGEGTLINRTARTATVSALTLLDTYCLSPETFDWLVMADPGFAEDARKQFDLLQIDRFLKRASPFAHLTGPVLRRLVPQLKIRSAAPADVLVREGDPGDEFFLVRSGRVEVLRRGRRLAILGPGDFFGEIALLTTVPRTATVRAIEEVSLLTLSREAFAAITEEQRSVRENIEEIVRIRFGRTAQSVALPDPVTTFIPFVGDSSRRDLWRSFTASGLIFALLACLAAATHQPLFVYGALLCGALIAPTLFLTYLVGAKLLAERPAALITTCLIAAALGLPLATFVERQLGTGPGQLAPALGVAVIEELAKIVGVLWLLRRRALRFRMDGIIYGAAAGMGFAALESALYALARLSAVDDMLIVLFFRSLLAPFGHGAWTAFICAAIWRQKGAHPARPSWEVVAAFAAAVLLHALWDWRPLPQILNLVWVLAVAALGIVLLRSVLQRALREESGAVSALNPGATGALGPTLRVPCAACGQLAPSGVRYCPRCGVALRALAA